MASEKARSVDVFEQAVRWTDGGVEVALATVVSTGGSSPRPIGSQLASTPAGDFVGSVSGGCVEGAVIEASGEVLADGRPRLLPFGYSDEMAWEVGLPCGGSIEVYIEKLDAGGLPGVLQRARDEKRLAAVVTRLEDGASRLLIDGEPEAGSLGWTQELASLAVGDRAAPRSRAFEHAGHRYFVHVFEPRRRVLVIGGVHIAQQLYPMAQAAGYEVTIVDPRGTWATPERFPGVTLDTRWPDEALADLAPDRRTAVVTLSHDPKFDEPALIHAVRSPAFYIGALGSRRNHAGRVERLREQGLTESEITRISAPIGLDLGAVSPAEIAVSIIAEITAALHEKLS